MRNIKAALKFLRDLKGDDRLQLAYDLEWMKFAFIGRCKWYGRQDIMIESPRRFTHESINHLVALLEDHITVKQVHYHPAVRDYAEKLIVTRIIII